MSEVSQQAGDFILRTESAKRCEWTAIGVENPCTEIIIIAILVFFSAVGGDALELFAAPGAHAAFGFGFRLVGDVASGGLPVFTLPRGAGMDAVIGTEVGDAMRGVNAGAYVRIPFEVPDPEAVDSLSLAMRFNDGFVAWLNGIEVARWNAPAERGWDSGATAAREADEAYVRQTFNATAAKAALVAGTNVLAIHGLNVAANDASFLVLPELSSSTPLDGGLFVFNVPTPGEVNGPTSSHGRVRDTVFSVKRGIYDAPVTVAIATETPGAMIRYTTDGSVPTETHGNDYTEPLLLAATTVLRAAAFKDGYDPTNVDTHSYVFPADLVAQSPDGSAPPGWPTQFSFPRWDYGMDPEIVANADPAIGGEATVVAALRALPVVSLVLEQDDFSGEEGIYANAYERGRAWERAASIELLNDRQEDAGGVSFQAGCGLRIRGNYSRAPDNPKHSFRVFFRSEYGDGKLRYRLFGDAGAEEFDGFGIQTPHDAMWAYSEPRRATYLRDTFCRATAGDMGRTGGRSGFAE